MQRRGVVVAIDGPSGSGKSTVARAVASRCGLRYLDTGAMYRALTWLALSDDVDPGDAAAVAALAERCELTVRDDPADPRIWIDGHEVTREVRSAAVTAAVSRVSAVPAVRATMVDRQRALIGEGDIVVEGRDIGTTVAPDSQVKIYLVADPATRASRRAAQEAVPAPDAATTEADLQRRDSADSSRAASPLRQAEDAVTVDSSSLSVDEVAALVVDRVHRATADRR